MSGEPGALFNDNGFHARAGNNAEAAESAGNNIYFKLLPANRIAVLYLPWPYARTVSENQVAAIFSRLRSNTDRSAFIRDDFGLLKQAAVVDIEHYTMERDRIVFECGALAACSLLSRNGHVEWVRPGIINDHITRYDFVATK